MLLEGIIGYVSSAYLHNMLPADPVFKSPMCTVMLDVMCMTGSTEIPHDVWETPDMRHVESPKAKLTLTFIT